MPHEPSAPHPAAWPTSAGGGPPIRILLVDDNAVNLKVNSEQLKRLGYAVDCAGNGLEALRALEFIPYRVILMDCQMPEMDGYEATRRMRAGETRTPMLTQQPRVYIIAMTTHALVGDREKRLAAGMEDHVGKPVHLDELRAALTRWRARAPVA